MRKFIRWSLHRNCDSGYLSLRLCCDTYTADFSTDRGWRKTCYVQSLNNHKAQLAKGHGLLPANCGANAIGLHMVDILVENALIWACLDMGACHGILPPHLSYTYDAHLLFQALVAKASCLNLQHRDFERGLAARGGVANRVFFLRRSAAQRLPTPSYKPNVCSSQYGQHQMLCLGGKS